MSDIWPEQDEILLSSSSLKKRKMDPAQVDAPHSINTIRIIPPNPNLNASFHLSYTGTSKHSHETFPRLQCHPRKRRTIQQPCFSLQQPIQSTFSHQAHLDTAQTKLLYPTICVSTPLNTPSPPVSPKTLVPNFSQQNPYTTASFLRPCHICHRRPATRELLEAYADCDLCTQRACFICLRQCDSVDCGRPNGQADLEPWRDTSSSLQIDTDGGRLQARHPTKICSCCAVEGVTENGMEVVRCLACIQQLK